VSARSITSALAVEVISSSKTQMVGHYAAGRRPLETGRQAVTLMRDKLMQRGGQFSAQLVQRQVGGRQRGHLPVDLPG